MSTAQMPEAAPAPHWRIRVRGTARPAVVNLLEDLRVVDAGPPTVLEGPVGPPRGLAILVEELLTLGLDVVEARVSPP